MNGTILYTADVNAPTGFRAATLEEIMSGARQALALRVRKGTELNSPQRTRDYLMTRLANREFETFTLIYLDNRHRLIACEDLFRGTIDGASVHPCEVVKEALKHNAAAVILAHNQPLRRRRAEPRRRAHHSAPARSAAARGHPSPRSLERRRRRDPQVRGTWIALTVEGASAPYFCCLNRCPCVHAGPGVWRATEPRVRLAIAPSGISDRPELALVIDSCTANDYRRCMLMCSGLTGLAASRLGDIAKSTVWATGT
jgi:hypothetical protein